MASWIKMENKELEKAGLYLAAEDRRIMSLLIGAGYADLGARCLGFHSGSYDFFDMFSAVLVCRFEVMQLFVQARDIRFELCCGRHELLLDVLCRTEDEPAIFFVNKTHIQTG